MKVFSAAQIKAWDAASIEEQEISSLDLMERAAARVFEWISRHILDAEKIYIFCGKGNNGGDGLALARMLINAGKQVHVYVLETGKPGSADFQANLFKLHSITTSISFCQNQDAFPSIEHEALVIDAIFGTGLNKPVEGLALMLIQHIRSFQNIRIAIDLPSGMYADGIAETHAVLPATHTLSFQSYKLSFLLDEQSVYTGKVHLLDIGLSPRFAQLSTSEIETIDEELISMIVKPRNPVGHKGSFGHAALIAGKRGMMGAAILSAKGCLVSGAGKTSLVIPEDCFPVMQTSLPEVICISSGEMFSDTAVSVNMFSSVGLGPGLGVQPEITEALKRFLEIRKNNLVLDADALNNLSAKDLEEAAPENSVITPHPKEFDALLGKHRNGLARLETARAFAERTGICVVLKGHFTAVVTPGRKIYFNVSGNDGMAKGGSGDVLTGLITGLVAQGYLLPEAAIFGVYLHGRAGDIAAARFSRHAMQPSHIVECLAEVWKRYE